MTTIDEERQLALRQLGRWCRRQLVALNDARLDFHTKFSLEQARLSRVPPRVRVVYDRDGRIDHTEPVDGDVAVESLAAWAADCRKVLGAAEAELTELTGLLLFEALVRECGGSRDAAAALVRSVQK